jgi:hypothetical protein
MEREYISKEVATILFPENLEDWWRPQEYPDFPQWAWGVDRPESNWQLISCWNRLHPDHTMIEGESIFRCICKMIYIYEYYFLETEELDYDR